MSKKGLTLEEHRALGLELQSMRNRLVSIAVQLDNAYPLRLGFGKRAGRATAELDYLRSGLDNQVFKENPEQDETKLQHVYYPPPGPPDVVSQGDL